MNEFQAATIAILGFALIILGMTQCFRFSKKRDSKKWALSFVVATSAFLVSAYGFHCWADVCRENNNYLTFETKDGKLKVRTLNPLSKAE